MSDLSPMLGGQSELTGREPMLGGDKKLLITTWKLAEPCECEECNRLHRDMVDAITVAFGLPAHVFFGDNHETHRRLHR